MSKSRDWTRRPELILSELLKNSIYEKQERHYRRALVLAVDQNGGKLQNSNGSGFVDGIDSTGKNVKFNAAVGVENPANSIKARILTDSLDRLIDDNDTRVFWPMFPPDQLSLPIVPGEHVYVVFEGNGLNHGLWLSRVPGHDSANFFKGFESYTEPSNKRSAMDSFEKNDTPKVDDSKSALAPGNNAFSSFGEK